MMAAGDARCPLSDERDTRKSTRRANDRHRLGYTRFTSFTPTVQINARYAKRDSGEAADTFAAGGKLVYLTVGVKVAF